MKCENLIIAYGLVIRCQTPASIVAKNFKHRTREHFCFPCFAMSMESDKTFVDRYECEALET